jgi:hypothetical protein
MNAAKATALPGYGLCTSVPSLIREFCLARSDDERLKLGAK